jgi:hypothetical protein
MTAKALTGLFASALLLAPSVVMAQVGVCTPGDVRPCRNNPGSYPTCYEECTSWGNWTTSCFCDAPAAPQDKTQASTTEKSSQVCETKPAAQQPPAPKR